MAEPVEIIVVETDRVACNGGGGALGHPRVYLNLGAEGAVDCPYCGLRYVLKEGATAHAHAH
ncbi:MAG: zinc-finger domain-containing protein [Alphaproteobacteria bacterium]|nr:zinc-finger domain-containing protein [Alphaproteobacteria bacterium]